MKQFITYMFIIMTIIGVRNSSGSETKLFPIGALFPMTGAQGFYGRVMSRGAQLAIDMLNAEGGVEGYQLKLIITDFENVNKDLAIKGIQKMIESDRIPFVLVSFSAIILAVQPICAQNQVLMINPGAYSPHLMNKSYLYSTKLIQNQMVPPMIDFFWNMNIRKLGLIYVSNQAGIIPANEIIKPEWTRLGGMIVAEESHPPGLTDYRPYLFRIHQAKPDAIYDISTGLDQAYIVKNAREMGIDIPITIPDWASDYFAIAGKFTQNVYIPGDLFNPESSNPHTKIFVEAYEARYRECPEIFAANYYDAVYYLLRELIKRVVIAKGNPLSGDELEKAIWLDPTFDTIYGDQIKLNRNGTCSNKPMGIFKIIDGKKVIINQVRIP